MWRVEGGAGVAAAVRVEAGSNKRVVAVPPSGARPDPAQRPPPPPAPAHTHTHMHTHTLTRTHMHMSFHTHTKKHSPTSTGVLGHSSRACCSANMPGLLAVAAPSCVWGCG